MTCVRPLRFEDYPVTTRLRQVLESGARISRLRGAFGEHKICHPIPDQRRSSQRGPLIDVAKCIYSQEYLE